MSRNGVISIGIVLALPLIFFWRTVFLGQAALPSNVTWDALANFYPIKLLVAEQFRQGLLPLWNPYILGGMPLLADVLSAPFYPLDVLYYLFPNPLAYSWLWIVYLWCAGTFTYIFLRQLCQGKVGPLIGAIVFMFNGTAIGVMVFKVHVATLLWLPLMLLATEKLTTRPSLKWASLLAAASGVSFLAGHTQTAIYLATVSAIYGGLRLALRRPQLYRRALAKGFALLAASLFLGIALAAVQLLPSFEMLGLSAREAFTSERYREADGWEPRRFIYYGLVSFIPEFFLEGDLPMPTNPFLRGYDLPPRNYVGLLPLGLILIAVALRKDTPTRLIALLAGGFLLAFFLLATPAYTLATQAFPPLGVFLHRKGVTVYIALLAMLAGLGADHLLASEQGKQGIRRIFKGFASLWMLAALGFAGLSLFWVLGKDWLVSLGRRYVESHGFGTPAHPEPSEFYYGKVDFYVTWFSHHFNLLNPSIFVPILLGAVSILLMWLFLKGRLRQPQMGAFMVAIVVVDLFYAGWRFFPFTPVQELYPETEAVRFLKGEQAKGKQFRVLPGLVESGLKAEAVVPTRYVPVGTVLPSHVITPSDTTFHADTLIPHDLQSAIGYESLTVKRYIDLLLALDPGAGVTDVRLTMYSKSLLDMLNARYLISTAPLDDPALKLVIKERVWLYENPHPLPRVWLVNSAKVLPPGQGLRLLVRGEINPGKEALLEEDIHLALPQTGNPFSWRAEVEEYSPGRVRVRAATSEQAILILADTFYPGWKAKVNGKQAQVFPVDYVFRGLLVDPGEHRVEFAYEPDSFRIGWQISLAAALGIAILGGLGLRRTRAKS